MWVNKMKFIFKGQKNLAFVILPLLLSGIHSSYAAEVGDTVVLKVTGKIIPASCSLMLGSTTAIAGELAYGNITSSVASVSPDSLVHLGQLTLPGAVTLNCDGPTLIGVSTTDNRSATVDPANNAGVTNTNGDGTDTGPSSSLLGLGVDSKNVDIGVYSGNFINLKVDGSRANFSTCMDEKVHTGAVIENKGALVVGSCPAGQSHQILDTSNNSLSGSTYVWDYIIDTSVNALDNLDHNGWKLDGSVTVQINYL